MGAYDSGEMWVLPQTREASPVRRAEAAPRHAERHAHFVEAEGWFCQQHPHERPLAVGKGVKRRMQRRSTLCLGHRLLHGRLVGLFIPQRLVNRDLATGCPSTRRHS
jgi:hypothetical protein